ncbi:hypothetical protein KR222_004584 [Zaprionus bogoriensis]|nr:hypothetical protein KR222_004584 [Zaprionus bogoriensis]
MREAMARRLLLKLVILWASLQPGLGVKGSPGIVVPAKVEQAIGSDLNISCTIDIEYFKQPGISQSCDVSQLYFTSNAQLVAGRERIYKSAPYIRRINDTTILFTDSNLQEQDARYVCMCGPSGIDTSHVYVGTKPSRVQDFNCTSYDWDYMFCNFTEPKNSIITKYNVSFATQKNSSYHYFIDCNFDAAPLVNCNITGEMYKKFNEHYYFRLDISNALGQDSQTIEVNNVERMILARPGQNLVVLNITKDAICLSWVMPRRSNFIGGVLWQVHVIPENFPTIIRPMWRNSSSVLNDTLCLTELPYAGYKYLLELRVRNNKTKSRWSQPLSYPFRTASERPDRPPRITNGSFYVYSSEAQLTVYWEQLEKHEMNGDNFGYVISEYLESGTITDSSRVKVDANSATIENWNPNARHELYIRSRNEVGLSQEASHLIIPGISNEDTRLRVPKKIRSVYHSSNSSYTLSWRAPENVTDLINYTVFWCNSKPAVQSKCSGSIHFEHVAPDQLQFTTRSAQPISLNMAVSANYADRNTGMHWMSCSRDVYDDLAKMEPTIEEVTNSSLTVKWSTERVCPAILSGYNLTYCQRSNGKPDNCTTKVLDPNAVDYVVQSLEPYTYYSVKMFMYSTSRASKYSDELIVRTGEAAPTQPRQLEYSNVSSSGCLLTWRPPLKANGVVRAYEGIFRHDNKTDYFKLPASTDELVDTEKLVVFELGNLTAYTAYEVSIRARTLYNSEPSNVISFRTGVGVPSQPMMLRVDNIQQSTWLEWTPPENAAGPLEFYEVAISERDANNTLISSRSSYIGSQQNRTCVMSTPICTALHRFHYQVRAVNAEQLQPALDEEDNMTMAASASGSASASASQLQQCVAQLPLSGAAWSSLQAYHNDTLYRLHKSTWLTHEVSCSPDRNNLKFVLTMLEVAISLVILAVTFHIGYRKYQKMSDIDLVLPPGIMENLKKPIEIHGSMGMHGGGGGGGGGGVAADAIGATAINGGGIVCTRVMDSSAAPQYLPQYSPQDAPHDFNSGSESSKLLLANNSSSGGSGGIYDDHHQPVTTLLPPISYMSMSQHLLLDEETPVGGVGGGGQSTELHSNAGNTGYIKPTQMKNWQSSNLPPAAVQLSGYVPVHLLQQARPAGAAAAAAAATTTATPLPAPPPATPTTPMHLLSSSNYVQASDLHKLKPLAPPLQAAGVGLMQPMQTQAQTPAPPPALAATPQATKPMLANSFGYTTMEQLQRNGLMKPAAPAVAPSAAAAAAFGGAAAAAGAAQQHTQQQQLRPLIGGYVTQLDLNALAHNRHML